MSGFAWDNSGSSFSYNTKNGGWVTEETPTRAKLNKQPRWVKKSPKRLRDTILDKCLGRKKATNSLAKGLSSKEFVLQKEYSKSHRRGSLIKYLYNYYGGPNFLINLGVSSLDFSRKFFKEHKHYQAFVSTSKYAVPVVLGGYDLVTKLRDFYRDVEPQTTYDMKVMNASILMDLPVENVNRVEFENLGQDIVQWILGSPKTDKIKILSIVNSDNLEPIKPNSPSDETQKISVFVLINIKEDQFVIEFKLSNSEYGQFCYGNDIYYTANPGELKNLDYPEIYISIVRDFISSFDTKANILHYRNGLSFRKRVVIPEHINQFDVDSFVDEIKKVLDRGKKRGYALVGLPGTGKTSITAKLEDKAREYPMICLSPNDFVSDQNMRRSFEVIKCLKPCIVVLEDLDAYGFEQKTGRVGDFLSFIDDVKGDLNCVFIATINDTSRIHYSLIDRPGRFDEVIMVRPPSEYQDIYDIMRVKYDKEKDKFEEEATFFPMFDEIDASLYEEIAKRKYTQADIVEVVEKAMLFGAVVSNDTLKLGLETLNGTKDAIRECNFNNEDPSHVVPVDGLNEPCQEKTAYIDPIAETRY